MTDEQKALPDPTTVRQSLHWSERWREKISPDSWLRKRYDRFWLPVEKPSRFTESHDEIAASLMPRDDDGEPDGERTKEILAEAVAIYAEADDRGQGAERRATTLLGAVAIATSLLLSSAALLMDPSKISGGEWRAMFALTFIGVVVCFVIAGARALTAISRIHVVHMPTPEGILTRSSLGAAEARIELAAETLKDYGYNTKVAAWKVAYLRDSAKWFGRALVGLLVLAVVTGAYVVCGPTASDDATPIKPRPQIRADR